MQEAVAGWHLSRTVPGRWWHRRQVELAHPRMGPRAPWERGSSSPEGLGRTPGPWLSRGVPRAGPAERGRGWAGWAGGWVGVEVGGTACGGGR